MMTFTTTFVTADPCTCGTTMSCSAPAMGMTDSAFKQAATLNINLILGAIFMASIIRTLISLVTSLHLHTPFPWTTA